MRAGKRRCFITIEEPVDVKQNDGSVESTWQTYKQLWANIETLKGGEKVSSSTSWPSADQKITFRYVDGITTIMRVVYNGLIYSILNVNNVEERNREIILTTNSGVKGQ